VISSRTTIGVAIVPAVFALCAKCGVLVKDREDALAGAFFATLGEELGDAGDAPIARAWHGERDARDLDGFDAVVAFGDDATLPKIRAQLAPHARWIGYGTKASCGYVGRDALVSNDSAARLAAGAARDLVLYDTEGCLSLHALFVERDGAVSLAEFAAMLARAVERARVEFPLGTRETGRAAAVAAARDAAAFRAATGRGAVFSDARASYLVALDPPREDPPLFLPRALAVYGVNSPSDAAEYVERHTIAIEAMAVGGMRPDIVEMALRIGSARIAAFGELQSPPLQGYHGGRPRIAEFVRWVADET
jgi:hypothetical protein